VDVSSPSPSPSPPGETSGDDETRLIAGVVTTALATLMTTVTTATAITIATVKAALG